MKNTSNISFKFHLNGQEIFIQIWLTYTVCAVTMYEKLYHSRIHYTLIKRKHANKIFPTLSPSHYGIFFPNKQFYMKNEMSEDPSLSLLAIHGYGTERMMECFNL